MATTREDVMYPHPVSNDTELDMEVGRVAEEQKRTTGQSADAAQIKAQVLANGFKPSVAENLTMEEDMRRGHLDTLKAKKADIENLQEARDREGERLDDQVSRVDEQLSAVESAVETDTKNAKKK